MSPLKVSVIVPLYNAEKFAQRCIDSILCQTLQDFEVLLIDDGSKDKTGEICDKAAEKDKRFRVFHKENGGVSSARNIGLNQARGEWVTFVDADDWIEPNYLKILEETEADKCDWIFADWRTLWNDGRPNEIYELHRGELIQDWETIKTIWNEIASNDICRCPWGKFFKKAILDKNNLFFDESLRYGEDTVFNYQYLTFINSIRFSNTPDSDYIFHQTAGTRAIYKYKCTPEGIITVRDKIFEIFYGKGLENIKFERLIFFGFTMLEHCYLGIADSKIRKDFYNSPLQKKIENRCLPTIKFYDRMMYYGFKYCPHTLIYPLAKQYLNYR